MTQAQNVTREPTMEEILASIRRIIEDGNPPLPQDAAKERNDDKAASGSMSGSSASAHDHDLAREDAAESDEEMEFRREFGEDAIADSLQHAGAMAALGQKIGARNAAPLIEAAFHRDSRDTPVLHAAPDQNNNEHEHSASALEARRTAEVIDKMEVLQRVDELPEDFAPEPEIIAQAAEPQPAETHLERHLRPILSDMTGRQVAAAFSDLTSAIEKERQQSLAEIAEDMIRPMLQEWLDNNLPTMVERLVREEIERVSRSGRR